MSDQSEMSVEERIRANAEIVRQFFLQELGVTLNYDTPSVQYIDGYIERNRLQLSQEVIDKLIDRLGSFVGECMRHQYGGEWKHFPDMNNGWGVAFDEKNAAFPFHKISKQFANGSEDSVASFYTAIPILMKLKRP